MKKWKVVIIFLFIFVLGAAIIGRLFKLQVADANYWKALAMGQQMFFSEIKGDRGEIFITDKNQAIHPLAINKKWLLVYLNPRQVMSDDYNKTAEIISEILNIDEEVVLQKIQKDNSYEVLKTMLSSDEVNELKKANIYGLYFQEETIRHYPQGSLGSHIAGFVGGENKGQYGTEGHYNNVLDGIETVQEGKRWPGGYLLKETPSYSLKGEDIFLTIDYNIQFAAEKILKEHHEFLQFKRGTIIVGDPYTGEILSIANFPDFDPNFYSKENNLAVFKNYAFQNIFEPGSVFKPITLAIGLEEKKLTPQTPHTDYGSVQIGGYKINNYDKKTYGQVDMTEVLEKSINTGLVFAEKLIGHDLFNIYLERFGFFAPTGIDLQGEVFSENKNYKQGYEINYATASFGQGIEVNAMQLFKAFSALANGGKLVLPHVRIQDNTVLEQVISPKTSAQITSMMVSVVEKGFGQPARIPGYYIAGKTGTAQVPYSYLGINKKGYSSETIQAFIGYAPAFDPKFLIYVSLDFPQTRSAGYSAGPIFKELAQYIIDYYQIPPDYNINETSN